MLWIHRHRSRRLKHKLHEEWYWTGVNLLSDRQPNSRTRPGRRRYHRFSGVGGSLPSSLPAIFVQRKIRTLLHAGNFWWRDRCYGPGWRRCWQRNIVRRRRHKSALVTTTQHVSQWHFRCRLQFRAFCRSVDEYVLPISGRNSKHAGNRLLSDRLGTWLLHRDRFAFPRRFDLGILCRANPHVPNLPLAERRWSAAGEGHSTPTIYSFSLPVRSSGNRWLLDQ
jgi:hypothetical protein